MNIEEVWWNLEVMIDNEGITQQSMKDLSFLWIPGSLFFSLTKWNPDFQIPLSIKDTNVWFKIDWFCPRIGLFFLLFFFFFWTEGWKGIIIIWFLCSPSWGIIGGEGWWRIWIPRGVGWWFEWFWGWRGLLFDQWLSGIKHGRVVSIIGICSNQSRSGVVWSKGLFIIVCVHWSRFGLKHENL